VSRSKPFASHRDSLLRAHRRRRVVILFITAGAVGLSAIVAHTTPIPQTVPTSVPVTGVTPPVDVIVPLQSAAGTSGALSGRPRCKVRNGIPDRAGRARGEPAPFPLSVPRPVPRRCSAASGYHAPPADPSSSHHRRLSPPMRTVSLDRTNRRGTPGSRPRCVLACAGSLTARGSAALATPSPKDSFIRHTTPA